MLSILQAEWYKLRKTRIIFIIFVGPLIGLLIGLITNLAIDVEVNQWYIKLLTMNLTLNFESPS